MKEWTEGMAGDEEEEKTGGIGLISRGWGEKADKWRTYEKVKI